MKQLYFVLAVVLASVAGVVRAEDGPCHTSCKHNAQIYLGSNCQYTLQPDDVLHYPPAGCYYDIEVYNSAGTPIGNTVNSSHVGQTLNVKVTQGIWSCWGSIVVHGSGQGGGPVAICDNNTVVTLGAGGTARVYWQTIDDGSYVSCGGSVASIQVRRKHPGWCPPGVVDDTQFRDYVEFCCEDAGRTVQVVLRVTDHYGNYNECWANVHVQDKSQPTIKCPPNITISCDNHHIDLNDLSQFGTVEMFQSDVDAIIINDPYYYPNGGFAGYDGYISGGGCGGGNLWVQETVYKDLHCGQGTIYRTFTIENTSISCTQKIFIRNPHYHTGSHIDWPDHTELDNCVNNNTDPDITGRPITPDDDCALYATSYRDEVFSVGNGACFKILRHWAVIDWCIYKPGTSGPNGLPKGRWEYTQVIKLNSSDDPVFTACKDTTFCPVESDGCKGLVQLLGEADDDCTPQDQFGWHWCIDINNDGVGPYQGNYDIIGDTRDASGYYPYGTHKVYWRVEDLCGGYNTCTYLFTVEDCKKPSPICYGGISTVVMPASGMIELNAEHFDASSFDNCTPHDKLIFSFSTDVTETTRIFDCNNIGTNEVRIWVTDEAGNQQFCTSFLQIDDNDDVCPDTPMMMISGHVMDHYQSGLAGNQVNLLTDINIATQVTTEDDGYFSFGSYAPIAPHEVEIKVDRDDDPLNGVSVLDLLLMQRHVVGLDRLEHTWELIAADVNGDGDVDVRDVLQTREVMLDPDISFGAADAWTFIRADEIDAPQVSTATKFTVTMSTDQPQNLDLIAIKLGDINGDADMSLTRSLTSLLAQDAFVDAGQEYILYLSADSDELTAGLDLRLPIDLDMGEIVKVQDGQGRELPHELQDNMLRILDLNRWSAGEDHIVSLTLRTKQTGWISEIISTRSGFVGNIAFANDVETGLKLTWSTDATEEVDGLDARVFPNPFTEHADVVIKNAELNDGLIRVLNSAGQVIVTRDVSSDEHVVRLQLNDKVAAARGMYFIDIQLGDDHKVIKAVRQ